MDHGRENQVSERKLLAEILRRFGADDRLRIWRANSGVARFGDRFVRFGVPGQADISGILRDGRRIEIETKTSTGRLSRHQEAFCDMIRAFGGVYVLARCVRDVEAAL